jgi:hypothetical protein
VSGTETAAPAAKPSLFTAALMGGIAGALLTAVLLLFAAPGLLGSKIVRAGLLAAPRSFPRPLRRCAMRNMRPCSPPIARPSKHRSEARGRARPSPR